MLQMKHALQKALICLLLFAMLLCLGCGAEKAIDWNSRVGVYTLQQAVQDYGEPDGMQELSDGTIMYAWYDSGRYQWRDVLALIFADGVLVKVDKADRD